MTTFYTKPDSKITDLIRDVMHAYHQRLEAIDLKLSVLMAHTVEDDTGQMPPALKLHGYPALAITKILSLKWRAHGLGDAEILIDAGRWELMAERQRIALIDHELTHLEPITKDDSIVRDDLRRPKLEMRLHDIEIGAFADVAARHGPESIERQQYDRFVAVMSQIEMDFVA